MPFEWEDWTRLLYSKLYLQWLYILKFKLKFHLGFPLLPSTCVLLVVVCRGILSNFNVRLSKIQLWRWIFSKTMNLWYFKDFWNSKRLLAMCNAKKGLTKNWAVLCICTFTCVTYFIFTVVLWIWDDYPNFTGEKTETQSGSNLEHFTASKRHCWNHEGLWTISLWSSVVLKARGREWSMGHILQTPKTPPLTL